MSDKRYIHVIHALFKKKKKSPPLLLMHFKEVTVEKTKTTGVRYVTGDLLQTGVLFSLAAWSFQSFDNQ